MQPSSPTRAVLPGSCWVPPDACSHGKKRACPPFHAEVENAAMCGCSHTPTNFSPRQMLTPVEPRGALLDVTTTEDVHRTCPTKSDSAIVFALCSVDGRWNGPCRNFCIWLRGRGRGRGRGHECVCRRDRSHQRRRRIIIRTGTATAAAQGSSGCWCKIAILSLAEVVCILVWGSPR